MSPDPAHQDAYDVLFVHPTAPAELIATTYWALAGDLQRRRDEGERVDQLLHHLTRSYECVADADRRLAYNASIGFLGQPLTVRPLPPSRRSIRSRLLRSPAPASIDLYEVIGAARDIPQVLLPAAHRIMRDQYMRLPPGKRQTRLLRALDVAYETLSSPEARERYDARTRKSHDGVPTPSPAAPPVEAEEALAHQKVFEATATAATPAGSPLADAPTSSPPQIRLVLKSLRLLSRAALLVLSLLAAGIRIVYQAISWCVRKARSAFAGARSRRRVRRAAVTATPAPSVASNTKDPAQPTTSEVELFLGRVATSVKESETHLQGQDVNFESGKSP